MENGRASELGEKLPGSW